MRASETPASLVADLGRLAAAAQADGRIPSVSAAVARGGEAIWAQAIGFADVEEEREATPDDQYRIGSITKTFTAAATMILRDEGPVELDAPISDYLDDVPHAPTVRRLLSHASGLQREVPGDYYWETLALPGREEMLSHLASAEQVLDPGSHWHYSNLAFVLLGELVASVSGTTYEQFIEERLLAPLGLERTTWESADPAARPYFTEPYSDGVRREADWPESVFRAAGELWSTTGDLLRWGAFLCDPDPEILRPETVDEMHRVQIMADERWTVGWGLGIGLNRSGDRVFGGHGGGMPGFITRLAYSRREKVVAAALANGYADMDALAVSLAAKAADAFPAEPEEWRPGTPPPEEVTGVLGRWWSEGDETILSWRRGKLEARRVGDPADKEPSVFEEIEPDVYRTSSGRERGEILRVTRDEEGVPIKLYWASYPFLRTPEVFGARAAEPR